MLDESPKRCEVLNCLPVGAGLARDDFAFEVDWGSESRAGPLPQGRVFVLPQARSVAGRSTLARFTR
jgi:hypothetical protein